MKFLFLLVVPISYFTPLSLRPASFWEIKAINKSVTIAEPDAHARSLVKHLGGWEVTHSGSRCSHLYYTQAGNHCSGPAVFLLQICSPLTFVCFFVVVCFVFETRFLSVAQVGLDLTM